LLVLDVDGVLTNGMLLYGADGELGKGFHVRDGLGIRLLREGGVEVGVISGRAGAAAATRFRELGLAQDLTVLGSKDKVSDLAVLCRAAGNLSLHEVAAVGDDLPDIPLLQRVGFSACPADAAPEVAAASDLICGSRGGMGVVREVAELILKSKGVWTDLIRRWTDSAASGS
jgi:3-deoxy-D-manno-octulosonate 8-phosphate phosphatase (KDO 8-P phosphatase)